MNNGVSNNESQISGYNLEQPVHYKTNTNFVYQIGAKDLRQID